MVLGLTAVILFGVVDTFYVGRLGAIQLAAMGFTFPVTIFVMSISMGMGMGVASTISRAIGGGDRQRVRRLATDGLILANASVIIFAAAGFFSINPLFRAMGASPETLVYIRAYMVPWFFGVGFLVIPMVGNAAIRATGDTKTPSIIMMIAGGLNIVLDPLLIFGLGPFPRLEIQGAAIATVISWTITLGAALWILHRREHMLDTSRPKFSDVWNSWREILYVGLPAAGTSVMVPLAGGILTRMVSAYGPEAVAAYGVGTRIEALAMIGVAALSTSLVPFVGQNYGAGNCHRIRQALSFSVKVGLAYGLGMAVLLAALAFPLARMFNTDAVVVDLTTRYLFVIPISYGLFGTTLMVNAIFNALNKPLKSALIIVLRLFVFALPFAFVGARMGDVIGIYAGITLANVLIGVVAILMARRYLATVEERLAVRAEPRTI